MAFIQIIEYRTSKPGEMQAVGDEWAQATEGKRKARRRVLCQDRDNDGRYFNIVFFTRMKRRWKTRPYPRPIGYRRN